MDFDVQKDRIISVGDLIDIGPRSMECLELLEHSWFYAVRGNHEEMFLDCLAGTVAMAGRISWEPSHKFFAYGHGAWVQDGIRDYLSPRLMRAFELVSKLPYIIVVGAGADRYHVVHADLMRVGMQTSNRLVYGDAEIDDDFAALPMGALPEMRHSVCWSRRLMRARGPQPTVAHGLSTTYCGHTPGAALRYRRSHVCLDLGAHLPFLTPAEQAAELARYSQDGPLLCPGLAMIEPATVLCGFIRTNGST